MNYNNFKILEEICSSNEIKTYRVTDNKNTFILKTINSDTDLNKSLSLLENDFEIMSSLKETDCGLKSISLIKNDLNYFSIFEDDIDYIPLSIFIKQKQSNNILFTIIKNIVKKLEIIHLNKIIFLNISLDSIFISKTTFDIKFTDFSISTKKIKQESQWKNFKETDDNTFLNVKNDYWNEIKNSTKDTLSGSPFFISPESTGRNNRDIDYRSDFYSLGILIYYLFTNSFPFKNKDLLSVIHFHLAGEIQESILEDKLLFVVKKLLNKNAEERYQSEKKLLLDLECIENNDKISNESDISSTFIFQQKLYGREKESEILLQSFNFFMQNSIPHSAFVSGYSGIGKTSLIKEIGKKINEKKVYFLKSKYDVLQRVTPLYPIIEIFKSLVKMILGESDEVIKEYEKDFVKALGNNAKIIIDIIPELQFIIGGPQEDLPTLSPSESSYRLYSTLINFIKVFSSKDIPLIMFLDDVQWVDPASLALLNNIIVENKIENLFFIFAYRDNEVLPGSPFSVFMSKINKNEKTEINLQPLTEKDITNILSDSLFVDRNQFKDLSLSIFLNTKGNPFFIIQFIQKLVDDGLIFFDSVWKFDIEKIKSIKIDGDIIGLLIDKFNKLNSETIEILKIASTIGNKFTLSKLSNLTNRKQTDIKQILNQALEEEFLTISSLKIKKEFVYSFKHDKIQEAFYKILEEDTKIEIALTIARSLNSNKNNEEELFDIVNNFNVGFSLITDISEIETVLELNLRAGKKAKEATAYQISNNYFVFCENLLLKYFKEKIWKEKYDLTYELYIEYIESLYLSGQLDLSIEKTNYIIDNSKTDIDKCNAYNLLIIQNCSIGQYSMAHDALKIVLEIINENIPNDNFELYLENQLNELKKKLDNRDVLSILNLNEMTDPLMMVAIKIFTNSLPMAYNLIPYLFPIISIKMVSIFLEYGICGESYGLACYAIALTTIFNNYKDGFKWSSLAVKISEKFNNDLEKTKNINVLANYANLFINHIHTSEAINEEGLISCDNSGEYLHGSYIAMNMCLNSFYSGQLLKKSLSQKIEPLLNFALKTKSTLGIDTVKAVNLIISSLLSENLDFLKLNEENFYKECNKNGSLFSICLYKIMKSKVCFIYENYIDGYKELQEAKSTLPYISGQFSNTEFNFYESLTVCMLIKNKELPFSDVSIVIKNQEQMKIWMDSCPENFTGKYLLVKAQLMELNGRFWEAQLLYDEAIDDFDKNDFIQNEAIALKLVGEFHYAQNNHKKAQRYLFSSYSKFKKWGAVNVLNLLKEKYPNFTLFKDKKVNEESIDLTALSKSSTLFFNEIKLSSLTQKIMEVILQNTGAQKGALFIKKNNQLEIQYNTNKDNIPLSVINYVERTSEFLVLDNAYDDLRFNKDRVIKDKEIKSILCMPILKASELIGVLYLENNLGKGFFTDDRFQFIKIISSQIGSSIENAILYSNLEERVQERTVELAEKNKMITDSINYAKYIQYATLPSESIISNRLKDFSVLFKPKDIVSGDFYWYTETDESTFIAVVDCTGHGVPGGFLSMIGMMLLSQIVKENKINDPINIIITLNEKIKSLLKNTESNINDSMEVCLCRIDKNQIIYNGSRPFYYMENNKLNIIKNNKNYANTIIELNENNNYIFYLTTDGIQDQHNSDRKKFTSQRLLKLIQENYLLSTKEQKEKIITEISNFQGNESQTDDMTLIIIAKPNS